MSDSINEQQIREIDLAILDYVIVLLKFISADHGTRNTNGDIALAHAVELQDLLAQRIEIIGIQTGRSA